MLIVLSPAKTLDFDTPPSLSDHSLPGFLAESERLVKRLRVFSANEIATLMGVSDQIAALNTQRFIDWAQPFTPANAKQAVLAFAGDVYSGLDAPSLSPAALRFAQDQLRILSGLYGVLRPLDLIQPYRLEMSTRLDNLRGKDLYAFWGERIANALNAAVLENKATVLVNLASEEYFKAAKEKLICVPVIQPVFEDWSSGKYKVVSFYAKRARGLMARWAIVKRLKKAESLKKFTDAGYAFDGEASTASRWVFRRRLAETQ